MKWRRKLFRFKSLFGTEDSNELFFKAVKENCEYHYRKNPQYRAMLESQGFSPDQLTCYEDIAKLPFLPTLLFKGRELYSVPKHRIPIKATSSGTKGKFSRIGFDAGGLLSALHMVRKVTKYRQLLSLRPTNYIIFGYRPHRGNQTAVTKTAFGATLFAPALHRTYALEYRNGKYEPDLENIIKAIEKYSSSRCPVRFMGFPSYTYFLMKLLDERGLSFTLPKHSKIMLGGGWKQFYKEQVDKATFYALAKKVLGIEEKNIVEFFGAVEHPILYCDCPKHHFHVPAYSRVIIRDVRTLEPVENGKIGLVNLITPMVKATPILSVMTDDLGVLHPAAECGCGAASPYLEIIGRVGIKDIKTCAAGAAELLNLEKAGELL